MLFRSTPGVHRPRTLLGERLNALVADTWSEVDVVVMCFPANEPIGPGDRFIAEQIAPLTKVKKIAVVTKIDSVDKQAVGEQLLSVSKLATQLDFEWSEIVPVSAVSDVQIDLLGDLLLSNLPEGEALYPNGELTDEPEQIRSEEHTSELQSH